MVKAGANKVTKTNSSGFKISAVIALLFTLAAVIFFAWFFHVGSTKEIVAVADQFKPDSSWDLVTNDVQPPKTFCGDVECPSVFRSWETKSNLSYSDLEMLIKNATWDFKIEGDCMANPSINRENVKLCSASGLVDGYNAQITIRSSTPSTHSLIGLNIWKE